MRRLRAIVAVACVMGLGLSRAGAQTPWTFVSSPDLFNSDIADLSGGADAAVAAGRPTWPTSTRWCAACSAPSTAIATTTSGST